MSCNCQNATPLVAPDGSALPAVADDLAMTSPEAICVPCNTDTTCSPSTQSEGFVLPSSWLDSCCQTEGLVILARAGNRLARFGGSGFIRLVNGTASVVSAVPIQLTTLWHRWWKTTPASRPIVGDPLEFPYLSIADNQGNLHAIKGGSNAAAQIPVWETDRFSIKPITELRLDRKGDFDTANNLQLVGYEFTGDIENDIRTLVALQGTGTLIIDDTNVSVLPNPEPEDDDVYVHAYSVDLGHHWLLQS